MPEVTKSDFARLRGVTPARVSQWIAEGKLHGPALIGDGVRAKIDLDVANEQLGGLDPIQVTAQSKPAAAASSPMSDEQRRIVAARAEQAEIDLRRSRRVEQEQAGVFVRSEDVKRTWSRELSELLLGIENWLPDLAMSLHRDFGVDRKLATVLLRKEFRAFRQRRSDLAQSALAAEPEMVSEAAE